MRGYRGTELSNNTEYSGNYMQFGKDDSISIPGSGGTVPKFIYLSLITSHLTD